METTEKSLMPQMSTPVERKLFEAPALGENGAASVIASYDNCNHYCRNATRKSDCISRCKADVYGGHVG